MTYSIDFRMQVLKSIDDGMTFAGAAEFYNLSPTTIQNWKRRVHSKTTRQTKPYKIPDDVLLNDVKEHPDDYQYERARRLNCSKTGIYHALKRLGFSQKKDLGASKSVSDQKSGISEKAWSLYAARLSHRLYGWKRLWARDYSLSWVHINWHTLYWSLQLAR